MDYEVMMNGRVQIGEYAPDFEKEYIDAIKEMMGPAHYKF